ncbi:MAG: hypothetical protein KDK78_05180, partial [Chlamydiia bacterium]|nr:hypothetical protein [Chlamydiia bacterium]
LEQFGLAVEGKEKDSVQILLWPQECVDPRAYYSAPSRLLDVEKREQLLPPIEITIKNGEIGGGVAAHMQLAYLFALKGRYAVALEHLRRAKEIPFNATTDCAILQQMEALFRHLPGAGAQARGFQLQALLGIRYMLRSQGGGKLHPDWESSMTSKTEIAGIYQQYQQVAGDGQSAFHLDTYAATELRRLGLESFHSALVHTVDANFTVLPGISDVELRQAVYLGLQTMVKPDKDRTFRLSALGTDPMDAEFVLSHFFELWELISDKRLDMHKLVGLFGAIPGFDPTQVPSLPDLGALKDLGTWLHRSHGQEVFVLDVMRRALLAHASYIQQDPDSAPAPIDIDALWRLRSKQLPSSLIGLALGMRKLAKSNQRISDQTQQFAQMVAESLEAMKGSVTRGPITPPDVDESAIALRNGYLNLIKTPGSIVDRGELLRVVGSQPSPFDRETSQILSAVLNSDAVRSKCEADTLIKIDILRKIVLSECGIDFVDAAYQKQQEERLAAIGAPAPVKRNPSPEIYVGPNPVDPRQMDQIAGLFEPAQSDLISQLDDRVNRYCQRLTHPEGEKGIVAAEDRALSNGLAQAGQEISTELASLQSFSPKGWKEIDQQLDSLKKWTDDELTRNRSVVLESLKGLNLQQRLSLPPALRQAMELNTVFGDDELIKLLKRAFQFGELPIDVPELDQHMTHYLILEGHRQAIHGEASVLCRRVQELRNAVDP